MICNERGAAGWSCGPGAESGARDGRSVVAVVTRDDRLHGVWGALGSVSPQVRGILTKGHLTFPTGILCWSDGCGASSGASCLLSAYRRQGNPQRGLPVGRKGTTAVDEGRQCPCDRSAS